jgi:hypothetical protein
MGCSPHTFLSMFEDKGRLTCQAQHDMNENNEPVINIRYRELMKSELAKKGQLNPVNLGLGVTIFVILLTIAWHLFRR